MNARNLPVEVIETDRNLEQVAESASGQLARHRWHWTLDESNPDAVTVSEYARQVGRSQNVIYIMAKGYGASLIDRSISLEDHVAKARMGAETGAAAEAVAKARGIPLRSASRSEGKYGQETRRVRDIARQLAEEHGTSVEQEAPKIAQTIVRHEQAQQAAEEERLSRTDIRFVEMEGYLVKAKRELLRALKLAPAVPWDDESKDLLAETVGNIRALLALIDSALSGSSGVDWDAEFAKVAGNENV